MCDMDMFFAAVEIRDRPELRVGILDVSIIISVTFLVVSYGLVSYGSNLLLYVEK